MLDAVEVRVLGCLLEKQQATPEYYPLTHNALVAELSRAAGQKESRWTHLVAGPPPERSQPVSAPQPSAAAGLANRVAVLKERVADLTGELSRLAAKLDGRT